MNERILKLVTEARQYAWDNETHWSAGPERERLFEEKFAQLIIQDCIDISKGRWANAYNIKTFEDRVKEHFGVEK